MSPPRTNPAILQGFYHVLRVGLGVVFIWASWEKIADPAAFARVVQNYQILPPALVNPTALFLPWVEAVCGVCLITGVLARGSLLVFNGLMAVFTLALSWNALRGVDTDCGCFSVAVQADKGRYLEYILRDLALLGAGGWVLWYRLTQPIGAGCGQSKKEA
jgi:uncharacterized membrane protein YphA (DoxX/SURF4 family)